jgi:hypothetical protein
VLYSADLRSRRLGGLLAWPADDSLRVSGRAAGLAVLAAVALGAVHRSACRVVALLLGLGLLTERGRAALL